MRCCGGDRNTGCGFAAFGVGLLIATLFPVRFILIVVAAMLVLLGFAAYKNR